MAQGFLAQLRTFAWDEPAIRPTAALAVALALPVLRAGLWTAQYPHLPLLAGLLLRRLLRRPPVAAAASVGACDGKPS